MLSYKEEERDLFTAPGSYHLVQCISADCVGAYNILRLYLNDINAEINTTPYDIKAPYVVKVAV